MDRSSRARRLRTQPPPLNPSSHSYLDLRFDTDRRALTSGSRAKLTRLRRVAIRLRRTRLLAERLGFHQHENIMHRACRCANSQADQPIRTLLKSESPLRKNILK